MTVRSEGGSGDHGCGLALTMRPTLLNGEPVEVVTDIVVDFTLAD